MASLGVASPGHTMGHCKLKCSYNIEQQPASGAVVAVLSRWFVEVEVLPAVGISRGGGSTRQPKRTEPCQCVSGHPWACHGALQGQTQPLHCVAGVVEPALGAAAGLGRWFVGVAVLLVCGDFQRR